MRKFAYAGLTALILVLCFSVTVFGDEKKETPPERIAVEGEPFRDEAENHIPPGTLVQDGNVYLLKSYEFSETVLPEEERELSEDIIYEDVPIDGSIPETKEIPVDDDATYESYTVSLPVTDIKISNERWSDDFSMPITIYVYDADTYMLGDREVEITDAESLLNYKEELLTEAGLDPEFYQIDSVSWDGGPYQGADGELRRDLVASGRKYVVDVTATYSGIGKLPERKTTQYQAVYELKKEPEPETEPPEEPEKIGTVEPEKPKNAFENLMDIIRRAVEAIGRMLQRLYNWATETPTRTFISATALFLLVGFVVLLLFLRRKAKKEKEKLNKP